MAVYCCILSIETEIRAECLDAWGVQIGNNRGIVKLGNNLEIVQLGIEIGIHAFRKLCNSGIRVYQLRRSGISQPLAIPPAHPVTQEIVKEARIHFYHYFETSVI